MNSNLLKAWFLQLVILISLASEIKASNNDSGVLITCALVGLGGLIGVSLLSQKSEAQVLESARNILRRTESYSKECSLLENNFRVIILTTSEKNKIINAVHQDINNQLYNYLNNAGVKEYLNNLSLMINELNDYRKSLQRCIRKAKPTSPIGEMENLISEIERVIPQFEFLRSYIKMHSSFFSTKKFIMDIEQKYEKEFKFLSQYKRDVIKRVRLLTELKTHARVRYTCSNSIYQGKYPLKESVEVIDSTLLELENFLRRMPFNYVNLLKKVGDIKGELTEIKTYLVGDKEYVDEGRAYEQAKIAEQKLFNEQQKINILRRGVVAKENENKIRAEELRIKEKEARERKERADAIQLELLVQQGQRPPAYSPNCVPADIDIIFQRPPAYSPDYVPEPSAPSLYPIL